VLPRSRDALRERRPGVLLSTPRALLRCLAALLLAATVAGCSARVFFYNRLDMVIPWYLGGYVDLDREQRRQLDGLLEVFLAWHRDVELPRYAALLDDAEALAAAEAALPDVTALAGELEAAWYRLRDAAVDWLLELGATLSEEQIDAFLAELRERQAEYEEEYLPRSDEAYRDEALESMEDGLADYLGRLDASQVARLETAAAALTRIDSDWLAVRARWIDRVAQALEREPGWQERLRADVRNWEALAPASYLEGVNGNSAIVLRAVTDVLAMRSERQDRRLARELASLRRDLETLMSRG
jgi:hypothetical protein